MKKYLIERDVPEVGNLTAEQMREVSARSNDALRQVGPDIQWIESFVAQDKTFCIYLAEDESLIRRHAQISGIPVTKITEIHRKIDPTTGSPSAAGGWR
jgi:Protein of unknown function (DUF4242)